MFRRLALPLAILALAFAGCGGGDDGDSDSGAPVRDIQPQAQQTAESIVLELSDFPNGWRASPAEEDNQDRSDEFRECVGADYSGFTITGEADSDTFAMGENAEAESDSTVFESEQDAAQATAEFSEGLGSTAAEDCVTDLITSAISDADIELGDIDVGELGFTPPDVDRGRAWQIAIPIKTQGVSVSLYLELALLREGNAVAFVQTQDVEDPFDSALRDDLLDAVATRMSEASS